MAVPRGRRAWLLGGFFGYVLVALVWAVAGGQAAARGTSPAAPAAISAPAAFSEPTASSPITLSADKNFVWVVNPDDDSVSVLRTDTDVVVAKIDNVGDEPQSVAVDPNNSYAYVANAASNNVAVIRITGTSPFGASVVARITTGGEPWNVVISPDGARVFVANSSQDTITVIKANVSFPTLPTVIGAVDLRASACNIGDANRHFQPRGMAVTQTSDRLFVTRFLSFTSAGGAQANNTGKAGVVCRIDLPATITTLPSVFTPIALAPSSAGFPAAAEQAYPNQLQSVVIRGGSAFLPNIAAAPAAPLVFNADTHAFVNRVDGVTGGSQSDAGALNLHLGARDPEPGKTKLFFANPWAIAFTNQSGAGNAYVVSSGSDLLVKLNVDAAGVLSFTGDENTTRYIDLNDPANGQTSGANAGKNPLGIAIRNIAPGNIKAYVMNYISRNVSVVDLATDSVSKVVGLTALPAPGSADEVIQIGAEMFFSSRGVFNGGKLNRLSSEGWQNCASCHFAGLTDGNVWAFGAGPRKSVPLNATWSPQNPDDQRVLNYSAIFDEVQDFEANIRNVSGPGNLPGTTPPQLDPNHGLLIGNDGNINAAPSAVNAFALPNAGRPQLTVTLPGSSTAVPALDALKEWVRFGVRTPNGALTATELTRDPPGLENQGNPFGTGGLSASDVALGRSLFFRAGCQTCHGGSKWSTSTKDFTSPPAAAEIFTETSPAPPVGVNPVATQYLNRFLSDIGSFNLGVAGQGNDIGANVGAPELAASGQVGLGKDHNGDGKGVGFNSPSLLGIWSLPPYYHNGACETLECVLGNARHRTANNTRPDVLGDATSRARLASFLRSLDAETIFPTDLRLERHDVFFDPPTVFRGQQVAIGANVSLLGTRADLTDLLNGAPLRVRFQAPGLDTQVDVPLAAFTRDFSTATISTTWNVPADASLSTVIVTVDSGAAVAEAQEADNTARRRVLVRAPPPDTTPPTVGSVAISDDTPFNDNDAITSSRNVQVKFSVTNVPSVPPAPTSELESFCIVRYSFDSTTRRWAESPCNFQPLPAPVAGSFTVSASLPPREGAAYAFVWVRDQAGNISRRPGFDFISFVPPPSTDISLRRNEVRVFRIRLDAGQDLGMTFTPSRGDIDVSVFDRDGNRLQVSANNGLAPETIALVSVANNTIFHVEVRAAVNSTFRISTGPAVAGLAAGIQSFEKAGVPDEPINLGPPPAQAAIDEPQDLFLPVTNR